MYAPRQWRGLFAAALLVIAPAIAAGVATADPPGFNEHPIASPYVIYYVTIVDLDADGDLDVIGQASDAIYWYENDGAASPGFTLHTVRTQSSGSVWAADIDGDGDIDVASATGDIWPCSSDNSQLAWSENDGGSPPSFTQHTIVGACIDWRSVYVADINGDGHQDILTGHTINPDHLSWYESDGGSPPAFSEQVIRDDNVDYWGVWAEDLDGDGDKDVINGFGGPFIGIDGEIDWYENDGGSVPGFTAHMVHRLNTEDKPRQVMAADLDGDGDPDIIGTFYEGRLVYWYENDGASPPSFAPHEIESSAYYPMRFATGDVDLDGDVDLLISFNGGDVIAWYENDGASPPLFTPHAIPNTLNAAAAEFGDLDGDGDLDLVATDHTTPQLNWYENLGGAETTISAWIDCVPAAGTVPFLTNMSVSLTNRYAGQRRRIAASIRLNLAGGQQWSHWKSGTTQLEPGASYFRTWNQNIPALWAVVGANTFTLLAEDVTPAPYNQPPYPPAGDTDTDACTVTGIAP